MKDIFRYSAFLLPFLLFGLVSFSLPDRSNAPQPDSEIAGLLLEDTIPPTKAELKQQRAQKKLEMELKKAKYKEAKEKSKLYSNQAKSKQPVSAHNQNVSKQKKSKKESKTLSGPSKPGVTTKVKSPKKEKGTTIKTNDKGKNTIALPTTTKKAGKDDGKIAKQSSGILEKPGKKKKNTQPDFATPSGKKGVANNPLPIPEPAEGLKSRKRGKSCDFAYNVTDPITGQSKSALESRYFFGFTEKELMQFMKGEDYLSCRGYLSQVTGVKTLNLTFVIDSPYARDEYGSIQAGSQMIIRLINGETVTLVSEKYDSGSVSRRTGKTTYKTLFIISAKDEKLLAKSEVDIVRMVWGTGYEDYEVYELDFFIDQLACLNAVN